MRLMAQALDLVTSGVPATFACYVDLRWVGARCVVSPFVVKFEGDGPEDPDELVQRYLGSHRNDPLREAVLAGEALGVTTDRLGVCGGPRLWVPLHDGRSAVAIIALCRREHEPNFSEDELGFLEATRDLLQAAHLVAVAPR